MTARFPLAALLLAALMLLGGTAGKAWATAGDTLIYGGGQGRVTFDGQLHAAKGYVCNDCHLQLFPTARKGLISFADHKQPKACFACHNGEVAFKKCTGCHRDVPEPPVPSFPAAAHASQPVAAQPASLSYEGATTIGTKIMPEATKLFADKKGITFTAIGGAGANAGFKAVVEGRAAIGGLASDMTPEQEKAVGQHEVIGYDVMGVFINPANPVKSLSSDQVRAVFAGRIRNWKDLGGADQPITVYSEKLDGGRATVKAFQALAMAGEAYGPVKELDDATDCIDDVAKDPSGIAASSLSFAKPEVAEIAIDGTAPTREAVQSGSYRLKRPLILVARAGDQTAKAFFDFMLEPEAQAIVGKSFVPAK